jgi:hypothetical protein
MSSSSRSIAAARQKRAGEQSQQMNTSRPVTSISSQGAFAQQYQQQMMAQNIPIGSKNVRIAQNKGQIQAGMNNANNNQKSQQLDQSTKISVSNAIGLITLRLGRLENLVSDAIDEGAFNNGNTETPSIPTNMKLVSDEVFENIVNRLNLIESKIINFTTQNEKLENEMTNMQSSIVTLNSLLTSFVNDTNEKFVDYENALAEIENNFEINNTVNIVPEQNGDAIVGGTVVENVETMNDNSITNDLESDNKSSKSETSETIEAIE